MKVITESQLKEAAEKFPIPEYVYWYSNKFPSRQIAFVGAGLIFIGVIATALKAGRMFMGILSLTILVLVVFLCTILYIAIRKKRNTFKKRADYLGITLHECMSYEWDN